MGKTKMRWVSTATMVAGAVILAVPLTAYAKTKTFTNANWDQVQNDSNQLKGDHVSVAGEVFVAPQYSGGATVYQVYLDPASGSEAVLVGQRGKPRFSQGDYVSIRGIIKGQFQGQNALGGTVIDPMILATSITKVNATSVLNPTIAVSPPTRNENQHGLVIRVYKVEYAKNETRVYVRAINHSGTAATIDSYSATLVQGSRQLQSTDDFNENLPTFPDPMANGVSASAVLTFQAANIHGGKLSFDLPANNNNFNLNWNDYVFTIQAPRK